MKGYDRFQLLLYRCPHFYWCASIFIVKSKNSKRLYEVHILSRFMFFHWFFHFRCRNILEWASCIVGILCIRVNVFIQSFFNICPKLHGPWIRIQSWYKSFICDIQKVYFIILNRFEFKMGTGWTFPIPGIKTKNQIL